MSNGSSSWPAGSTGPGVGNRPGTGSPVLARIGRAVFAVIAGVLLYTLLAWTFETALGIESSPSSGGGHLREQLVAIAGAALLTGYAAAWIAGVWEIALGTGLGLLMGWGAGAAAVSWQGVPDGLDRVLALAVMVPAGFLGGALRGRLAASRRAARALRPPLELPVEVRMSRGFVALGMVLSLGMAGAGAWALRLEDGAAVGWEALLFFGAAAVLLLWALVSSGKAFLVFGPEGIEGRMLERAIPWAEVGGASISPVHPIEYVRIHVRDPEQYLREPSPLLRVFLPGAVEDKRELGVATMGQPFTADELCEVVNRWAGAGTGRK